jgi:hypothetical protein
VNPKQKNSSEGYNGLYLERSGESARDLVEVLMNPPEVVLDDEEKSEVYAFEASIGSHELGRGVTIEAMIGAQKGEDVTAPLFFAEPFLDGSVDMTAFGNPEFHSQQEVYQWAAKAIQEESIETDEVRAVAKQSAVAYKEKAAQALLSDSELTNEDSDSMSLVLQPKSVIEQNISAEEARQYLLWLRKKHTADGGPVDGAKRAVVDVYLARVNEVIAKSIPAVDYLIRQSRMIGDEQGMERAQNSLPSAVRSILDNDTSRQELFKRLDYLRNGLGVNEHGSTAVSDEVLRINETEADTSEQESIFTPEQTTILKQTMVEPAEMQAIFSRILAKAGLLSEEDSDTWSTSRKNRARDELFQVVINPTKATFEVDGTSGVYKVASEPRSLFDVLVVGGFHELSHINQAQADRQLGETFQIANVKGKRPSMIREGGANMNQREAETRYFGKSKPFALTYARALQTLESGGSLFAATRAFYDEKRRIMPDTPAKTAAKEAADRVIRLIRQGGRSSQAMAYAEEGILSHELASASPAAKERAMAITSLDLVDQVRLHRYGLLPEIPNEGVDWSELVADELAPYIRTALQDAQK